MVDRFPTVEKAQETFECFTIRVQLVEQPLPTIHRHQPLRRRPQQLLFKRRRRRQQQEVLDIGLA